MASGFLTIPALKKQCWQREKSIKKCYTVSWCKLTEFTKNWTLLIVKITKQINISVSYFYHNYNLLYWSASSITQDNWSSFQRGFVLLLVWRNKSSLLLRGFKFSVHDQTPTAAVLIEMLTLWDLLVFDVFTTTKQLIWAKNFTTIKDSKYLGFYLCVLLFIMLLTQFFSWKNLTSFIIFPWSSSIGTNSQCKKLVPPAKDAKNTTTTKLIIFGTIRRNQFIKMSEPTFTRK